MTPGIKPILEDIALRKRFERMEQAIKDAIRFIALRTPLDGEIGDEWDQMRDQLRAAISKDAQ